MTKEEARRLVKHELSRWPDGDVTGDSLLILDDRTLEKSWGWVFFYNAKRFIETGDILYALAGNAPYIGERTTGRLLSTGTAYPLADYLAAYERTGDPHGA